MASVRSRAGKWQVRIRRHGHGPVAKTFLLRADAERWARSIELELDRGLLAGRLEAERVLVGEVIARYKEEVLPLKRGAAVEGLRLDRLASAGLGRLAMARLTPQVVAQYRDSRLKSVASGTVLRELQILSAVINHAIREWGIGLAANPVTLIRRPAPCRGRDRRLQADEQLQLLTMLSHGGRAEDGTYRKGTRNVWVKPVVELALETAMRRGELLALRWKEIDLERRVAFLPITKNGDSRKVPLSPRAVEILSGLPRHISGKVFPITPSALQQAFGRACKAAGVEGFRFHDLRHCALSRLAERGLSALELSAISGHKTLQQLARYVHMRVEDLVRKLA